MLLLLALVTVRGAMVGSTCSRWTAMRGGQQVGLNCGRVVTRDVLQHAMASIADVLQHAMCCYARWRVDDRHVVKGDVAWTAGDVSRCREARDGWQSNNRGWWSRRGLWSRRG
jgi:hypothetical protein